MTKNKIFAIIHLILGILVIIIPSYLVPVCASPMMGCRARTLPLVVLTGMLIIITSIVEYILDK